MIHAWIIGDNHRISQWRSARVISSWMDIALFLPGRSCANFTRAARRSPAVSVLVVIARTGTGVHIVVVFDGKGKKVEATSDPADVQIFYSRSGQSADSIIERLASKYAKRYELMVATSDSMEAETVHACGAESISPDGLRELLASARRA